MGQDSIRLGSSRILQKGVIMTDTVIVAIISLIGTLAGTMGGIIVSNNKTTYRLSELEKKVEKHNSVIDRTYHLEESQKVTDERIKVINHRINDLENNKNKI